MTSRVYRTGIMSTNGTGARFTIILFCTGLLGVTMACRGYKVNVRKVENCAGANAIITAEKNYSAELTSSCDLKLTGCVWLKDYTAGISTYTIKKNGVQVYQGSVDLCNQASPPIPYKEIPLLLKGLGVPDICPVRARQVCTNLTNVMNIKDREFYLPFITGKIVVEMNLQHDTGESCFNMHLDIKK